MSSEYVLYNKLPALSAALKKVVEQAVRKAALDIEREAKQRAPVQTGFLRNSIYAVTHEGSDYGQDAGSPPRDSYLLDEVEKPKDGQTAFVAVGANYGMYVEMGTSRMSAQPYLLPAADVVRPQFAAAMSQIEARLKEQAEL